MIVHLPGCYPVHFGFSHHWTTHSSRWRPCALVRLGRDSSDWDGWRLWLYHWRFEKRNTWKRWPSFYACMFEVFLDQRPLPPVFTKQEIDDAIEWLKSGQGHGR